MRSINYENKREVGSLVCHASVRVEVGMGMTRMIVTDYSCTGLQHQGSQFIEQHYTGKGCSSRRSELCISNRTKD